MKKLKATHDGFVEYVELRAVEEDGKGITLNKTGYIAIYNKKDIETSRYELARFSLPAGAEVLLKKNEKVSKGQALATWDPSKIHLLSEQTGIAKYLFKDGDKKPLYIEIVDGMDKMTARYRIPQNTEYIIKEGESAKPGTLLATAIAEIELLKRKILEEVKTTQSIEM